MVTVFCFGQLFLPQIKRHEIIKRITKKENPDPGGKMSKFLFTYFQLLSYWDLFFIFFFILSFPAISGRVIFQIITLVVSQNHQNVVCFFVQNNQPWLHLFICLFIYLIAHVKSYKGKIIRLLPPFSLSFEINSVNDF